MNIRQIIAAKRDKQKNLIRLAEELCKVPEGEDRNLSDAEMTALASYREQIEKLGKEIDELAPMAEAEKRHADTVANLGGPVDAPADGETRTAGVRTQPRPQWRTAGEFLVDMCRAAPNGFNDRTPDQAAADRIATHERIRAEKRAQQATGDTPGLLPENIVGDIVTDVDDDRPFVKAIGAKNLANITGKTFNRPVVTAHTASGEQLPSEGSTLVSQKMTINGVPFTKKTVGGYVDVTRQDIDWTDPAAWDALLQDMAAIYAEESEDLAVAAWATAITMSTMVPSNDLNGIVAGLYDGAYKALTNNGAERARTRRLPNAVFTSADMWKAVGTAIDQARSQVAPQTTGLGSGGLGTINGTVLDLPRIMVPGLPAGTVTIGRTSYTEFYEQRVGVLQAVTPSTFGVQVAYGGYIAYGTLDADAFCDVLPFVETPPLAAAAKKG